MASLQEAIDGKCRDCGGMDSAVKGTWRKKVESCDFTHCSLHKYRPRTSSERPEKSHDQTRSN